MRFHRAEPQTRDKLQSGEFCLVLSGKGVMRRLRGTPCLNLARLHSTQTSARGLRWSILLRWVKPEPHFTGLPHPGAFLPLRVLAPHSHSLVFENLHTWQPIRAQLSTLSSRARVKCPLSMGRTNLRSPIWRKRSCSRWTSMSTQRNPTRQRGALNRTTRRSTPNANYIPSFWCSWL